MLVGCQPDNTDRTITCGVVVDLGVFSAILLLHLVLTEIESVVCPCGGGVVRRKGRPTEKRKRSSERRGQRVRRSVEERARAAARDRGEVEGFGAPGGVAGIRGVMRELDGETPGAAVKVEVGERVRIGVWVGLC
jgi:hypothetical protein